MVKLLIGIDDEAPYGDKARTEQGRKELYRNYSTLEAITNLFERHNAGKTFFILGDYLQNSYEVAGKDALVNIYAADSHNTEIAQHTYNHVTVAPLSTRPDKVPVSKEVLKDELGKANALIKEIFGVMPLGLKTPLSYSGGVSEDIAQVIKDSGIMYVSADGRNKNHGINAPLIEDGIIRQPRFYKNGLLEIPTQGWHDSVFSGTSKTIGATEYPKTIDGISEHYIQVLKEAYSIEKSGDNSINNYIFVAFAMHPWSISTYDPELKVLGNILSYSKNNDVECMTHKNALRTL